MKRETVFGRWVRRVHGDERGGISVLAILMIWCLVALLGLLYNNAVQAHRRMEIQTAADSAAHGAAAEMARVGNVITAQNLVISQDAAAEAIWMAVPPTDAALNGKLNGELRILNIELARLQQGGQSNLQTLTAQMQQQLQQIANDRQLTSDDLANLGAAGAGNFSSTAEMQGFLNRVRQATSALNWTVDTYVNGNMPTGGDPLAPPRPGPPGPNGEGLAQLMVAWQPVQNEAQILEYIINFINTQEFPVVQAFEAQTQYQGGSWGTGDLTNFGATVEQHEEDLYLYEKQVLSEVAATVETQRQQFVDVYQTDLTLATPRNAAGSPGPATVEAPYVSAEDVQPVHHVDMIRMAYLTPQQAIDMDLPYEFDIDPINPQTIQPSRTAELSPPAEARIWHPAAPAVVPDAWRQQNPALPAFYMVPGDVPGGLGGMYAMPLEQYILQRIAADRVQIDQTYMQVLDGRRTGPLAQAIREMLGIQGLANIANVPGSIPDDQPRLVPAPGTQPGLVPASPPIFDQVPVLPRMTNPTQGDAALAAMVQDYNSNSARFLQDVRRLRDLLLNYADQFRTFTLSFASDSWNGNVRRAGFQVIEALGKKKHFMVLATYGLQSIPEWAKAGAFNSAEMEIEERLVSLALAPVPIWERAVAYAVIEPMAHQIAVEIATEWISRPWAYEIMPPQETVPPERGMTAQDRLGYFTVLAGARETAAEKPGVFLPRMFKGVANQTSGGKMVAYTQGEMFNWMEFNARYGGQAVDQVTEIPELTYWMGTRSFPGMSGSPRGWRVDSAGGWEWRARLSLSDGLYGALQVNDELKEYLKDAGVDGPSEESLEVVNVH